MNIFKKIDLGAIMFILYLTGVVVGIKATSGSETTVYSNDYRVLRDPTPADMEYFKQHPDIFGVNLDDIRCTNRY